MARDRLYARALACKATKRTIEQLVAIASRAEKPLAHRAPSVDTTDRDIRVYQFVRDCMDEDKDLPMKAAVQNAMNQFKLGRASVYRIFKRWAAADVVEPVAPVAPVNPIKSPT
jgi:hypothetical protein